MRNLSTIISRSKFNVTRSNHKKLKIDNTPVMTSFIHHITSVDKHGKNWLCDLKNGWRLRVTDSLMTEVAQAGR